ncbi:hypothetical protein VTK56DRAFT_4069 [Thermocarpiscus australiensis]
MHVPPAAGGYIPVPSISSPGMSNENSFEPFAPGFANATADGYSGHSYDSRSLGAAARHGRQVSETSHFSYSSFQPPSIILSPSVAELSAAEDALLNTPTRSEGPGEEASRLDNDELQLWAGTTPNKIQSLGHSAAMNKRGVLAG